jgi:alkanesulfonate monooxygenase SsuD/methylene tetrahydromethanopterin reductase-like flavin-dependent oxidoreductase (luciferase family)
VFGTFDDARERKQRLDEACERGGRDPGSLRYSLMAPIVVGRDDRQVQQSAQRIGERFGRDPKTVLERYANAGPVGTVEQCIERLREIEALGFERVMLQHLAHQDVDTVALIGRELAPAVA